MGKPSITETIDITSPFIEADYTIAEYNALREEILKRIEMQHQIISLTLIVAGTFFSINLQGNLNPLFNLIYPVLALFLATYWAQNGAQIVRIGNYIYENFDKHLTNGRGWENHLRKTAYGRNFHLSLFAARGIFIGTQLITLAIFLSHFEQSYENIAIISAIALTALITLILLRNRRSGPKNRNQQKG